MDRARFRPTSPGRLTAIKGGDWAFVPDPLPPNWEFPIELWPLLGEAKQQVGILEGLGRNLPNPAILLRPLEDREAIKSSRLEGTYASPKELLLFEMSPRESMSEDDPANQWREVFNYRKALHHGTQSNLPLSLRLIRQLHEMLLSAVRGRDRSPGQFRHIQVAIGTDRRFIPPPPEQVMSCLDPLEKFLHVDEQKFDPLVRCFLIHYQFETIHPFVDGNGRVGRLLLALMMHRCCGLSKPWLYLSEFFETHRDDYIERLFRVSTECAWKEWIEFCLRATETQARKTVERCQRLLQIRERYMSRLGEVGGTVRLNEIVESIFYSPYVQTADLARRLGVTYPTAKADMERLVEAGILRELKGVRPKTFYAPEVFDVAYDEMD